MGFNIKNIILVLLFSLVKNWIQGYKEINDGESLNYTAIISDLFIATKIEKDSQIIVDIKTDGSVLTKDNVRYSKYYKDSDKTAYAEVTAFVKIGDKHYKCTYDVSKDTNDYGLLWIKGLSVGEKLTISVSVYSKLTVWVIVVIAVAVGLVLIVAVVCILRKFLRCCIL